MRSEELEKNKWKFCPSKRCYYCGIDISNKCEEEIVVTSCPVCNYSFVE